MGRRGEKTTRSTSAVLNVCWFPGCFTNHQSAKRTCLRDIYDRLFDVLPHQSVQCTCLRDIYDRLLDVIPHQSAKLTCLRDIYDRLFDVLPHQSAKLTCLRDIYDRLLDVLPHQSAKRVSETYMTDCLTCFPIRVQSVSQGQI